MSIAYDIGFPRKPEISELDAFMASLGFKIESPGERRGEYTRTYVLNDDSVPREIEFFYEERVGDYRELFGKRVSDVHAYGNLKTFSTEPTHIGLDERLRIIEERKVRTQHEYYRHVSPERLRFYEIALALKEQYGAIVLSEQTGEEIDPNKPLLGK